MSTADSFIRVRLDKELKLEASDILSAMGLSISDLVRMTLTKLVNERDIPFSTYVPNKETIEAMNEKPEELKTYSSFAELLKEVEDTGDSGFLFALGVTKGCAVDMDVQAAGFCLMGQIPHLLGFLHDFSPRHIVFVKV